MPRPRIKSSAAGLLANPHGVPFSLRSTSPVPVNMLKAAGSGAGVRAYSSPVVMGAPRVASIYRSASLRVRNILRSPRPSRAYLPPGSFMLNPAFSFAWCVYSGFRSAYVSPG